METMFPFLSVGSKGIFIDVVVQPKASKNEVVGVYGNRLKVKVTAPPTGNAANEMCRSFLADILGISTRSIELIAGNKSRNKRFLIHNVTFEGLKYKLMDCLKCD